MNLRFLGSGVSAPSAKKKNTKEYRRRTSLLVDERLLINPTVDIFDFESTYALDGLYSRVEAILITDTASLDIEATKRLTKERSIPVYASAFVHNLLCEVKNALKGFLTLFSLATIGSYQILPLPLAKKTEHARECPYGFYIHRDKNIFYATPGGMLRYDAWQLISKLARDEGMRLDAAVLDCSRADKPFDAEDFEGLSLEGAALTKRILESSGVARAHCRYILSRIPIDKKRKLHEELVPLAEESGLTLSYDGYFLGL